MSPRHGSQEAARQEAAREAEQEDKRMSDEEQRGTAPMSHTPEPWQVTCNPQHYSISATQQDGKPGEKVADLCATYNREDEEANAARIVAAVNGCARLNPVAYRECVEALKTIVSFYYTILVFFETLVPPDKGTRGKEALQLARQALTHATGGRPE